MSSRALWATAAALALAAASRSGAAAEASPLEFHRVHVPAGRLGDVPLGTDRYVPMPLAEFDAAVARARAAVGVAATTEPLPPAAAARCRASIDEAGRLVGTIACDVGAATAGPGRALPLGELRVVRAIRVADPPREATVCGLGSGLALAIPEPGTYELEFSRAAVAPGAAAFRLPLLPALATTLVLDLPPGMRPVLSGPAARRAVVVPPAAGVSAPWRIDLGPAAEITITVEPRDRPPPSVAVWSEALLSGPRAEIAAAVVPSAPWRSGRLVLELDPAIRVTDVRAEGDDEPLDHEVAADGRSIAVAVPAWLEAGRTPLVIRGVTPATGPMWRLPFLRAGAATWAGGGMLVRVDPALAVRDLELEECRVVPPETAATWPLPPGGPAAGAAEEGRAATYHVEQQGPAAALDIVLGPRTVSFDVARVTTVDITPGAVLGRAACDVRVTGGEAFEVTARVASGWIIDAVDAVDAVDRESPADDGVARGPAPPVATLDWRVVPSPAGDALRIGLPGTVAGPRGIGLRIAGHRAGLVPGAAFTTADIDMVRFDGESADAAVIDLRTDADAFVEIGGRPAGWFEADDRLAPLVEEGKARGRIRAGDRAGDVEARLVRRRPPLDVRVDVRLEPRDDVIVQSYTFDCRADAGVDSLVVDFAEPGGAGLAWRVESPAGVAVAARPLDPAEGGLASRSDAIAASWLLELTPATSGPVRIRAVRTLPFARPVPVPLAWVEGAVEPGGTVMIVAPAGARPRLANRWLRELPGNAVADAPAEFAYGAPVAGVAAELTPVAAAADARAWAWRETVDCWCDESGAVESESRFDVENEGRAAVSLSLAPGRRLETVSVGGVAVPDLEFAPAGGTWRIPLPTGERRVEIVVRTLAGGRSGRGAWRVDPAGCALDVPVLDRTVRLRLPPELVAATSAVEPSDAARLPWTARLFGIGAAADLSAPADPTGYRSEPVVTTRDRGPGVLIVSRRLLAGVATLAAFMAGSLAFLWGRHRPARVAAGVVAAAVAALWLVPAFVPVARAAWWGGLIGLAWALRPALAPSWRRSRWLARGPAAAAAAFVLVAAPAAFAAGADVRVLVTPAAGGEQALVPEPLFRALAAFAAPESAAVRVLACEVTADTADAVAGWRLALDVDADAGGSVVLDAGPEARWLPPPAATAGIDVRITEREARLMAAAPGRHRIALALVPAVERRGPVQIATARIPVAPRASLRLAAGDPAAGTVVCERAAGGDGFMPATMLAAGLGAVEFDVSAADRVRLVSPVDPRDRLAQAIRAAATVNDLSWDVGGSTVEAAFDIDVEAELLRSFVVRADPRLEGLAVVAENGVQPRLEPLGGGRVAVELPEAVRGRCRVRLAARLPLPDPVGVFEVPGIWLDGVPAEQRTTRLAAAAEFDAMIDPAPAAAATAADLVGRAAPRLIVRRRRPPLRATQSLAVSFAPAGVGLVLEAQIDASAIALTRIPLDVPVGATVDRVALVADDPSDPGRREPIDLEWTRTAADRVLVLVQRPRPGRFRLEVEARLPRRPAVRGPLPVVRARLGAAVPLLVSWTAAPPLLVAVEAAVGAGRTDTVELPDGAADPPYELSVAEPAVVEPVAEPAAGAAAEARVERVEVRAAFDGRGRVHGMAVIEVVTPTPVARLRLPPGMRLFDVLVDGRVVAAEPRSVDAWDVPLGAAAWPRTILAVFAGDAGTALAERRPLELAAPRLEGLPPAEVLWVLRPPAGFELKVAPPARPLDFATLTAERDAAHARIAAACRRAAAAAVEPERGRLEALAALRGAGRGPEAEEAWRRVAEGEGDPAVTAVAATEPLVIRAVPESDATLASRAAATVVLVAAAGLAWTVASRGREPRATAADDATR